MKLSQIKHALNESKKMIREAEEEFGGDNFDQFLASIKEIEKHARERRVLEPNYSKEDLLADIKREIPDVDDKVVSKMADFVFGHLGESTQVTEAQTAEELEVGEPVKITGNVQFQGATGVIDSFGTGKRFVIVDLGEQGLRSFHSSDVSFNAEEEQDEFEGVEESTNPQDTITMDVPLFIRTLEFAREDAKDDMDLHDAAENALKLSANGDTLTMDNYDAIVPSDAVEESAEDTFVSALKGLKSWQVVIMNNYYAGKYTDYRGRYYYVIASSADEARQVVINNADAILQDLLSMKTHQGKKILPRGSAIAITDKRIGDIKDGTEAGRMTTAGFKKMFGPQGPMMVKLSGGAVVDVQGQEQGVAEGSDDKKRGVSKKIILKNLIKLAKEQGNQQRVQKLELELKKLDQQSVAEGSEEKPIKKSDWFDPTDMRSPEKQKAAYLNQLAAKKRNKNIGNEQGVAEGSFHNPGQEDSPVAQALTRRILLQRTDLLAKYGPEKVGQAIDEVADFVGDVDEIGSSDVSGWVKHVEQMLGNMSESDISGVLSAASMVKDYIITAEVDGTTKKFRVRGMSGPRAAKERFLKHAAYAKVLDVKPVEEKKMNEVTLGDYRNKALKQKAQSQMNIMFARSPEEREKNTATFYKRERGLNRLKARDEAARKAEHERQLADTIARLPELKAEYERMRAEYKSLGGSDWQYADREQNLTDSERKARAMEGPMNNLWRQINAAEKAQGPK